MHTAKIGFSLATYEELESGPVASVQIVKQYYDREVVFGKCYGTNTNTMMNGGTFCGTWEMICSLISKDTGVPKNPGLFLDKLRIFLKHTKSSSSRLYYNNKNRSIWSNM